MNALPPHRIFSIICLALIASTLPAMAQPACTPPPSGLVDWWPGESNANDIAGTNNGTLVNGVSFAAGEVGQAFSFNGSDYVSIPDSPSLDAFTTNITIELWLKSNQSGANPDWRGIVTKGNASWRLQAYPGTGTLDFITTGPSNLNLVGNRNVNDGNWHHVACVYDGTNKYLYVDGTLDVSAPTTGSISQISQPMYIGNTPNAPGNYIFNGLIDEVSIYNRALTASEIQAIYAAGSAGKCNNFEPMIITQPTNQTVMMGDTATFSVTATGLELNYQWLLNDTNIVGANESTLIISNVTLSDLGSYSVVVTNELNTATSSNAMLFLYPFIATPFTGAITYWGKSATLSVGAIGSGQLNYQWYFNGVPIDMATNATLDFTSIQPTNAGLYSVVVSSPYGTITNAAYQVIVNPANVSLGFYPGLTISGVEGYSYIIQSSTNLENINGWLTLTNLTLTQPVQLWIDTTVDASSPFNQQHFYQILPGQ
jgi:hypothetical protein